MLHVIGKSLLGGMVIGIGCAIVFKGSALGLAVALVGGAAWGYSCAKEYTDNREMKYKLESLWFKRPIVLTKDMRPVAACPA